MFQNIYRYPQWMFLILCSIFISGCISSTALKSDYGEYSGVYGDSNNQQLLLNLAREAHGEPIYFIQLASINSTYQLMSGLTVTPQEVVNSPRYYKSSTTYGAAPPTGSAANSMASFFKSIFTLGGSANTSLSQSPTFQFVPVTGTNFSQAVLYPISDKVFYTLYDQGWPADWLTRVMVQSVVIKHVKMLTVPKKAKHGKATPPTVLTTDYEYWVNDPNDPTYPKFLQYCNTLYYAQKQHSINVDQGSISNKLYESKSPKLADVVSAATAAGLSVYFDKNNNVVLMKTEQTYKFTTNDISSEDNLENKEVPQSSSPKPRSGLISLLSLNISPDNVPSIGALKTYKKTGDLYKAQSDADLKVKSLAGLIGSNLLEMKMRTFESVLYGVANEQSEFEYFGKHPQDVITHTNYNVICPDDYCLCPGDYCICTNDYVSYTNADYGPIGTVNVANYPPFNVRPILMMNYSLKERLQLQTLAQVNHDDVTYTIGDLEGDNSDKDPFSLVQHQNLYQNRIVFSIISYLFLQTSINTQSLPVQQLIQVP